MSLTFVYAKGAPMDYTVVFTENPDEVRALQCQTFLKIAVGTLYLPPYARRICPLRKALTALFEDMKALGAETVMLAPPTHLGYQAERFTRLLADWPYELPDVIIRIDEPRLPRNKRLASFAAGLLQTDKRGSFCEDSAAPTHSEAPRKAHTPHHTFRAPSAPRYAMRRAPEERATDDARAKALADALAKRADGFATHLFALIDAKGLDDVTCYKRANLDRKTFSKIRCRENYLPSKPTALALAIALKLNLAETEALLKSAGLALSPASDFDIIIRYCIENEIYNVLEINEVLFYYDQPLLGG